MFPLKQWRLVVMTETEQIGYLDSNKEKIRILNVRGVSLAFSHVRHPNINVCICS